MALQVTASNLVMVDGDAKMVEGDTEPELAASCIHLGIREVRPDAKVVMHTHQPYVTALSQYDLTYMEMHITRMM